MSLTIKYGTYTFAADEPSITVDTRLDFSPSGARERKNTTIGVEGQIHGSTLAGVVALVDALVTAAGNDQQDFVVQNGTDVLSHLSFYAGSCLHGPRITELSFPRGDGPELADGGIRTYRMSVEAVEEDATPSHGNVISFRESLACSGGSALYQVLDTCEGTAEIWQVSTQSAFRCTQEGEAVGRTSYPSAPAPYFPSSRIDNNGLSYDSPEYVFADDGGTASKLRLYRVRWAYEYAASSNILSGSRPHTWAIES